PCLYGYGESASIVGNAIAQAMDKAAIRFLGSQNQLCSFLSQKDLGELLVRVIDSWTTQYPVINIPGASSVTLGELGDAIKLEFPTVRLSYTEQVLPIATPVVSQIARQEYDWVPVHTLEEDMPELIKSLKGETISEEPTIRDRIGRFLKEHSFIVRLIELFLGFILMEFLNYITGTSIQFQNVDFRLLYVVLLGTLHGVKTGFSAAALACVSLIIAYINSGSAWYIIAYNVDSWLPFICYFVLGTITGYVKDRLRNDNKFLSEEKAILEDKYVLLNEFYVSAIQNKGQYKTQIMNYRDSFGRIFDVTRKLDHTVAEEVINEALHALEDILENQSICIYTCDNNMLFGRLIACSKKISGITEKSLVLSKLNDMVDAFVDGEVWSNKERLGGYPEYATPIFREDRLVALIIIQKVRYEQMAIYYENLIKIMCGLVKISLLRALEYTEKIEDEMYLEGTHVLLPEYFKDILRVKEEMVEDGVSEYTLLHFSTTEDNVRQTAQMLEKTIRTTDLLGLGSDGELYICLSQTNESNISFVLQRIKDSGLAFQQLENSEA
ncbi:MAG: hypothetical protein RR994_01585, partial [Clostridia bacterium]